MKWRAKSGQSFVGNNRWFSCGPGSKTDGYLEGETPEEAAKNFYDRASVSPGKEDGGWNQLPNKLIVEPIPEPPQYEGSYVVERVPPVKEYIYIADKI